MSSDWRRRNKCCMPTDGSKLHLVVLMAIDAGDRSGDRGVLVDKYGWQWVFYINVPFFIVGMLMVSACVHDPPYLKARRIRFPRNPRCRGQCQPRNPRCACRVA
jgi:hypothetical protein